jgi:hypothetical protein
MPFVPERFQNSGFGSRRGSVILVDESAESVAAVDPLGDR